MWRQRLRQKLKASDAELNSELGDGDGGLVEEVDTSIIGDNTALPAGLKNITLQDFKDANFNGLTPFNRCATDITDSRQISRGLLTPMENREMIDWLNREDGEVTPAMIVKMGLWFRLELTERIVKFVISADGQDRNCPSKDFRLKAQDSDSEPEPDATEEMEDPNDLQAKSEMIWQLKKELHALYRDFQRRIPTTVETPVEVEVPSYKQKREIAESKSEFDRMAKALLFGSQREYEGFTAGSFSGSHRLASRLGTMSISGVTDSDETMSVGSKVSGWKSRLSSARETPVPVLAPQKPDDPLWHPLKDQAVFKNFYPSSVPEDAKTLPVFAHEEQIRDVIASRKVTVISGMTGTGKSTQVPLMVMDACYREGVPCNIIVTQPRRLAAIGVARRVCQERKWQVGQLVGYQVGFDRNTSAATRLTYCTTGVFVEKIVAAKHLNQFTHVFLDEIHERDQDTDMALMLTRQMLQENSPQVKVILMSATFELEKIVNYFSNFTNSFARDDRPGKISIDVANHMIHETYFDEFYDHADRYAFHFERPHLSRELMTAATSMFSRLTPLPGQDPDERPSVLVFLPGLEHIQDMEEMIKAKYPEVEVLVLHSTINKEDQSSVLEPPKKGVDRVILSTNIAESSVTIPYIDYVFDFCLTKTLRCSSKTKIPQLTVEWASHANCQQRKGRVGRLRQGKVYFFVPRRFFKESLLRYPTPEILISPIEHSVLRVKLLNVVPPPLEVFVKFLDPPAPNDIELGILTLKEIGALTVNHNGSPSYRDGDLTLMGTMVARLPMDVRTAKFLILCAMFGYLDEGVTIAAGMSIESVLGGNNRTPERYKRLLDLYHKGASSDALALLYAWRSWNGQIFTPLFSPSQKQWCDENVIDHTRMKELAAMRRELLHRLHQKGISETPPIVDLPPVERMIPLLLAGAFYPNVLTNQTHVDDREVGRDLQGCDLLNTCVIDQFGTQTSYIAPLYDAQLKQVLKLNTNSENIAKIVYDTHQTYISFTQTFWSGAFTNVHPGMAVLRKRLDTMRGRIPLLQQVLPSEPREPSNGGRYFVGSSTVATLPISESRYCVEDNLLRLSPPDLNFKVGEKFEVVITCVENVASFWMGEWKDEREQIVKMEEEFKNLSDRNELRPVKPEDLKLNSYYLGCQPHTDAADQSDLEYARVKALSPIKPDGKVLVQLVDTGDFDALSASWLFVLPSHARDIPRACFEFKFSGVRFIQSDNALNHLRNIGKLDDARFSIDVYSILDGVVRGELFWRAACTRGFEINLNEEFVKLGYAHRGKEGWISEFDQKSRAANEMRKALPSSIDPVYEKVPPSISTNITIHGGPVRFPCSARLAQIRRDKLSANVEAASLCAFPYEKYPQDDSWPYRPVVGCFLEHPGHTEERLRVYHATALPVQPGLLNILVMAFAPYVELIASDDQWIGTISGLGPYPGKPHSFYEETEVDLPFDARFDSDDISQIQNLRAEMSLVLRKLSEQNSRDVVLELQKRLAYGLISVLDKPRLLVPRPTDWRQYSWSLMDPLTLDPNIANSFLLPMEVPPPNVDDDSLTALFENIVALHMTLQKILFGQAEVDSHLLNELEGMEFRCLLCSRQLEPPGAFVDHVYSSEHIAREEAIIGPRPSRNGP